MGWPGRGVGCAQERRAVALRHAAPRAVRPRPSADRAARTGAAWRRCSRRSPPSPRRGRGGPRGPGGRNGRWRRWPPGSATSRPRAPSRTGVVSTASMPGFDAGAAASLAKPTPGSGGMSATASAKSARSTSTVAMLADLHEALMAVLVIDGAGHPDRLVRRAEMRVAADLHRDLAAQAAEACQVVALGGFGQLPPDMELGRALGRAPAAFDDQRRRAEVADDMVELGRDVARVEIDDDGLHLQHVGGAGLALFRDRAGDDIDRRALARWPRRRRSRAFPARCRRPRSRCCAACRPGPDPCRRSRGAGSAPRTSRTRCRGRWRSARGRGRSRTGSRTAARR